MGNKTYKIKSRRALSIVLIIINAIIILPIIGHLDIGIINALSVTLLSIGIFLFDSRKGNLNNSFLTALIFIAISLTLDNAYSTLYTELPMQWQIGAIIIVAILYMALPAIVRFLLNHFNNHPNALLLTGRTIATIAGACVTIFIYLKSGFTIEIGTMTISMTKGWTLWSALVALLILLLLYQLSRNRRGLTDNHRFLYITVALYLLSMITYIGYIRDFITF